jgi:WD40 repeat protein
VWDTENGQELDRLEGLVQAMGVDWNTAGSLTAVGGADGMVHVWDMTTGLEVGQMFSTMQNVMFAEFSTDGERLFAIGDSHEVNVFDLSEALIRIPITTHGYVTNPVWSPDGGKFTFGQLTPPDYPMMIWDSSSGEELMKISGHKDLITHIDWSPSGDRLVTASDDTTVRIWDATTGEQMLLFNGHEDRLWCVKWSPDGSQIASGSYDGNVIIWDPITGEDILTFSEHQGEVMSIAWSPDGTHILSTSDNGEAIIWEAATGKLIQNLFSEDYNEALGGTWTRDGAHVVVQSTDGYITVFDTNTGKQRSQFFTISLNSGYFSLSPSEERILIGGADGVARVWDMDTGTQLLGYEVGGFNSVSYSPDGRYVLIGNTEGNEGSLQVFPTWHSYQELIEYAYECCVFRQLTPEERELFGLPER